MTAMENTKSQQETAEKEKLSKEVELTSDNINNINKLHEQQVQNVFEDEKTLSFIKQMRNFKQTWQ